MPKATLEYNLPEDQHDFDLAVKGSSAHCALHDIGQLVFRPARKHGYSDQRIQEALTKCGEDGQGEELVSLLEGLFYEIVNEWECNPNA